MLNTNTRIYLSSPHMSGAEQKYVNQAFDTNWVAPLGKNVDAFETDLKNYLDPKVFVTALSSGTAAIHLGLLLLDVKAGDEVLCQSLTFTASANPILYLKAIPVFIDSEPDTWNMCPIALEKAIIDRIQLGKKPKAIITVHLYGNPYKVNAIRIIAEKYQIPILEDAAEALGSSYKGQKCGTFGDLSVLSFNGNKIITTSGGGALISHTEKERTKAIFLATQARDNAIHYEHSELGYNYRLSNICASIGRGQMEVLDEHVALRRDMNAFYKKLFQDIPGVYVHDMPSEDYFSNHWLTAITINPNQSNGITATDLRLAFEAENIESRPLWKPLHLQPLYQEYPYYGNTVAQDLFDIGLCLPSGSNLTDAERKRIKSVVKNSFKIKKKIANKPVVTRKNRLLDFNSFAKLFLGVHFKTT